MDNHGLNLTLLEELTGIAGVSGREQKLAEVIRRNFHSAFKISTDPLGNLIAHLPGSGPKLLLIAHMDEVGLIVQSISSQGFLMVERIGGISIRSLFGNRMDLWTGGKKLPAIVGVLPGHLDNQEPVKMSDCYVDIGASSYHDAVEMGVQVGDVLTWPPDFQQLHESTISSKALDDRLGCFALLTLGEELAGETLHSDLYIAFVVQEETMLGGGLPVAYAVQPDLAIGIDGTLAFDTPDTQGSQSNTCLGKGPVLKWMDAIRGKQAVYVPDMNLNQQIRQIAHDKKIPLQHEVLTGLSTAITPIPYQGNGVRTAALSLPIRYHHSPIESANLNDVRTLIDLLKEFVQARNF